MSMKLVILGLLMEADSHPYEMRHKMKDRAMLNYIKMQEGSLYYAIDQLKKSGYVEVLETVKEGGRPDRTVYRITEAGRKLFQEMLIEQFASTSPVFHPMYAALVFAWNGDQEQIHKVLQKKLEEQRARVAVMERIYEEHLEIVPRCSLQVMKGQWEHAIVELRWLERLTEDAAHGRLNERGTPIES
ncbi:PadR family transcriptional regulator [Paenibacillus cremeus]|uniref:PadR family transcriptional regulator n=1 Tax=Paenibacillus cremeus TaxID=2163881 RepID=A0A559JVJ0_9BACL|nr:PadR family transcriptional regulator [Paenibacillus cremeus]TVY03914.1 PadR family transcriptional regulator [Paenibacillus cremeus]